MLWALFTVVIAVFVAAPVVNIAGRVMHGSGVELALGLLYLAVSTLMAYWIVAGLLRRWIGSLSSDDCERET